MRLIRQFAPVITALIALLGVAATGAQQDTDWQAWLYAPDSGQLTRVAADGSQLEQFTLPLASDETPPGNVAFSPGGDRLAYVATNESRTRYSFRVLDVNQSTTIVDYQLPYDPAADGDKVVSHTLRYNADSTIFNKSDHVAFGYNIGSEWQVIVFNLTNGEQRQALSSADVPDELANVGSAAPVVTFHNGPIIHVALRPNGENVPSDLKSFKWDLRTSGAQRVQQTVTFRTLQTDVYRPTDEIILTTLDERLPNRADQLPLAGTHNNSLHVARPGTPGTFPTFADSKRTLTSPSFIQNGERVLLRGRNLDDGTTTWQVINRDGSTAGTMPVGAAPLVNVAPLRDGFLFSGRVQDLQSHIESLQDQPTNSVALVAVNTRDGISDESLNVAHVTPQDAGHRKLVWTSRTNLNADGAGQQWAQLESPVTVNKDTGSAGRSSSTQNATPLPTTAPTATATQPGSSSVFTQSSPLTDCSRAQASPPGGNLLNLYADASTSAQQIGTLANGEVVALVQGPQSAEGFSWWMIRTADGTNGWTVGSANGTRVLSCADNQPLGDPNQNQKQNQNQNRGNTGSSQNQSSTGQNSGTQKQNTGQNTGGNQNSSNQNSRVDCTQRFAPANLQIGTRAQVDVFTGQLNMRAGPGLDESVVATLPNGGIVEILNGPQNADGYYWWQVRTPDATGWAADGGFNGNTCSRWLTAAPQGSGNNQSGNQGNTSSNAYCQNQLGPANLSAGDTAQVNLYSASVGGLQVRSQPSTNANLIIELYSGTQVQILAGPRDNENYYWWQISGPGFTGWAADGGGYRRCIRWLRPVSNQGGGNQNQGNNQGSGAQGSGNQDNNNGSGNFNLDEETLENLDPSTQPDFETNPGDINPGLNSNLGSGSNANANCTSWRGPVTINAPSDGQQINGLSATIDWQCMQQAVRYEFEIQRRDGSGGWTNMARASTQQTQTTLSFNSAQDMPARAFRVRIFAYTPNDDHNWPLGDWVNFTLNP